MHLFMKRSFLAYIALAMLFGCQENFERRLSREAAEFTRKHCPQEPEPGTRLDSITYDTPSRTYALWYTLSADNENMLRVNSAGMRNLLLHRLRNDEQSKEIKRHGVDFRYVYRSGASGSVVYELRLKAADYGMAGH